MSKSGPRASTVAGESSSAITTTGFDTNNVLRERGESRCGCARGHVNSSRAGNEDTRDCVQVGGAALWWWRVALVGFCWCCLAEVFSGVVVDLGDDLLEFLVGCGSKWVGVVPTGLVVRGRCPPPPGGTGRVFHIHLNQFPWSWLARRACQMVCVRGGSPYGRKHIVGYRQGVA